LIKIVNSKNEAISLCNEYFKRIVAGFKVEAILIEELAQIEHEYYISIALDASGRQFYIIASKEGGIDIEEVSKDNPEAIIKECFKYREGLSESLALDVSKRLGFKEKLLNSAVDLFHKLWDITKNIEAQLVEINPLVLTPKGLVAVDGKMILDDDSAFRQPLVQELQSKKYSKLEKLAKEAGFSFVELDGDIGILANGAGLTMALLDVLSELKLNPANFLDVGGGASKERVYKALELLFKMNPKAVLVNIFGGITRCDVVAEAIMQALKDFTNTPPLVIRLTGTNDKEGIKLLNDEGLTAFQNILDAIQKVKEVVDK
jgi:succinyl-CoA synthetase beta subunit